MQINVLYFFIILSGILSLYSLPANAVIPEECDDPEYTSKYEYAYGQCPEGTVFEPHIPTCQFKSMDEYTCYFTCTKACVAIEPEPDPDLDPDFEPGPIVEPDLPTEPSAGNGEPTYHIAGRLGAFDVNARGEFVYTIPLNIPAGTAGMQPNVSLNYNSGGFAGPMGVGWSASGTSAIARCGQRMDLDKKIRGVDFSFEDRFCLDGQRLVLIKGQYGKAESTYRLEHDNMTQITAYGKMGNGPEYFIAQLPNGGKAYYGTGTNSRRFAETINFYTIRTWAQAKQEDYHGNYISYRYMGEETGDLLLQKIKYTGFNDQQSPYNKVEFVYGDKPNPQTIYMAGEEITHNQQLQSIEMYERGHKVWAYQLAYEGREKRVAQLVSIQRCYGAELNDCSPKTEFQWNNQDFNGVTFSENPDYTNEGLDTFVGEHIAVTDSHIHNPYARIGQLQFGDFDGNGLTDIYRINIGLEYDVDHIFLRYFDDETNQYKFRQINGLPRDVRIMAENNLNLGRLKFLDINGDNRTDIYFIRGFGDDPYIPDDPWDVFENKHDLMFLFDVPINGLNAQGESVEAADYKILHGIKSEVTDETDYSKFDYDRIKFADFNGDGKMDLYYNQGEYDQLAADAVCYFRDHIGYQTTSEAIHHACLTDVVESYTGDATNLIKSGFYDPQNNSTIKTLKTINTVVSIAAGVASSVIIVASGGSSIPWSAAIIFGASQSITMSIRVADMLTRTGGKPYGGNSDYTRVADFNGDGLADIYVMEKFNGADSIYFSNGAGFDKVEVTGLDFGPALLVEELPKYSVGDFNGDGLADIYFMSTAIIHPAQDTIQLEKDRIYLSRGDGSFDTIEDPMPTTVYSGCMYDGFICNYFYYTNPDMSHDDYNATGGAPARHWHQFGRYRLIDIDSDGFTDLQHIKVNGFDNIYHWLGDENLGYDLIKQNYATKMHLTDMRLGSADLARTRYGDFNGDGMLDLYVVKGWGDYAVDEIYYNRNLRPKIVKISHQKHLGGEILVEYDTLHKPDVHTTNLVEEDEVTNINEAPYTSKFLKFSPPMSVVSQVKTSLINTKIPDQTSHTGVNYVYQGGRVERTKGFLGFRRIVKESFYELPGDVYQDRVRTTTMYHQLRPFSGRIESVTTERMANEFNDVDQLVSETFNTWSMLDGLDLGQRKFVYLQRSETNDYDVDGAGQLRQTVNDVLDWEINDEQGGYWFPTTTKTRVFAGAGAQLLHRTLVNTQYQHDTNDWLLGLPKQVDSYVDVDDSLGGSHEKWHRVVSHYDGNYDLESLDSYYKKGNTAIKYLSQSNEWDQFGNLLATEAHGEHIPESEKQRVEFQYTSDGVMDGRYRDVTKNVYGHESKVLARNMGFGQPVLLEDSNGYQFVNKYDQRGQRYKYWNTTGNYGTVRYFWCGNVESCIYRLSTYENSMPINKISFFDEHGRHQQDLMDLSGLQYHLYTNTSTYNALGQTSIEWGPKWATPINENFDMVNYDHQTYAYDDVGRVLTQSRFGTENDDQTQLAYGVSYDNELNQLLTTVEQTISTEPAANYKKTMYYNALGQIVKVVDTLDGNEAAIRYQYDALGNMIRLNSDSVQKTWSYDGLGRLSTMEDSSLGEWSYIYNGLGKLIEQTDGNGSTATMQYDQLGRLIGFADSDGATTWHYDEQLLGKLDYVERHYSDESLSEIAHYREEYAYNDHGLLEKRDHIIDGDSYPFTFKYYNASRLWKIIYPDGFGIQYTYSNHFGHIHKVHALGDVDDIYWQVDTDQPYQGLSQYGQVLHERIGLMKEDNYIYRSTSYYAGEQGNQVSKIESWSGEKIESLQDMRFDYDSWGSELIQRVDHLKDLSESYEYDAWQRLKASAGNQIQNISSYDYDIYGKLFQKSVPNTLQTDFQYQDQARPFLLTQAGVGQNKTEYDYDNNGNMLSKTGAYPHREFGWTSFNKPRYIQSRPTAESELTHLHFSYGPDRRRLYQSSYKEGQDEPAWTRLTLGYYEEREQDGQLEKIHYIPNGSGQIVMQRITNEDDESTHQVLLRDHLGSVVGVHDLESDESFDYNYDPFGQRRQGDDWSWADTPIKLNELINRGYTGHVPVDEEGLELIDMNARFYDPAIGRFISADTVLPNAYSSQDLDPYSYVNNRTLSMTDPTGHVPGMTEAQILAQYGSAVLKEVVITATRMTVAETLASIASQAAMNTVMNQYQMIKPDAVRVDTGAKPILEKNYKIAVDPHDFPKTYNRLRTMGVNVMPMTSLEGLVDNLKAELGNNQLDVLVLIDHGVSIYEDTGHTILNDVAIQFGDDEMKSGKDVVKNAALFKELGGFVKSDGCIVGVQCKATWSDAATEIVKATGTTWYMGNGTHRITTNLIGIGRGTFRVTQKFSDRGWYQLTPGAGGKVSSTPGNLTIPGGNYVTPPWPSTLGW